MVFFEIRRFSIAAFHDGAGACLLSVLFPPGFTADQAGSCPPIQVLCLRWRHFGGICRRRLQTPADVYRLTAFLPDDKLIDYYGPGAFSLNYPQRTDYKSRGNYRNNRNCVDTSNVRFYADLKQPELVAARNYQDYENSNDNWRACKEQLWPDSPDGWQIVFEGNG